MKRLLNYFVLAILCLTAVSCGNNRKKALLPNISGKAGEVIVVIDKGEWEGAVGTVIRDTLASDCPFLPQREPLYTLVDVAPGGFGSMFQIHRNIIIVNISPKVTQPGVVLQQDLWATPQCIIRINAADSESAVELFKENSRKIVTTLEQAERDRVIANSILYEDKSLAAAVTEMVGGSPHFPSGYKLKKKTDDFIWISDDKQYSIQGVFVYKYPAEPNDNFTQENIIAHRNAFLEANVPGMFENTYMITSDAVTPEVSYIRFRGRQFAETRGLWEVYNDFMGGPFVSHSFYSKDGRYIIVLDGFVYAPKFDKRQYLRQVEAIMYSFEWEKEDEEGDGNK